MSFLSENYIWIIVIAIVIIMAIIGYIADKHGFGKQNKKDKGENTSNKNKENSINLDNNMESSKDDVSEFTNVPEEASLSDFQAPEETISNPETFAEPADVEPEINEPDNNDEINNADFNQEQELSEEIDKQQSESEDLPEVELSETSEPTEPQTLDEASNMDESDESNEAINAEETNEANEPELEPVALDSMPEVESEKQEDFNLPNIDELNQEIANVSDNDEDVWKF